MKKIYLFLISAITITVSVAQSKIVYNFYKPGLSMRDKPGAQSTVITKIAYGEKITMVNPINDTVAVVNEGMTGYWNLIEYKGQKGYVVGIYLFDIAPPKATVKDMQEYFLQLSAPAAPPVTTVTGKEDEDMHSRYKKQLYKNGCEYHEAHFYESGYTTYFIPGLTLQQGFVLVRLIPEFKDVFGTADAYPSASKKIKMTQPGEGEKEIKVIKEDNGNWIDRIKVGYEQGAVYEFEMYELHGQLVISFGGGV